ARQKRTLVQYVLPLFVASFAAYPLEFSAPAEATPTPTSGDFVEAKGADGSTWRLFMDATTHLPARISWMDKPFVTATTTATMRAPVGSRGQPAGPPTVVSRGPTPPSGDPTIGL